MRESSRDEQGKFCKLTNVIQTLKRLRLGFFFFFWVGGAGLILVYCFWVKWSSMGF